MCGRPRPGATHGALVPRPAAARPARLTREPSRAPPSAVERVGKTRGECGCPLAVGSALRTDPHHHDLGKIDPERLPPGNALARSPVTMNAEVEPTVESVAVREHWGQSARGDVTAVGLGLLAEGHRWGTEQTRRVPFSPLKTVEHHTLCDQRQK